MNEEKCDICLLGLCLSTGQNQLLNLVFEVGEGEEGEAGLQLQQTAAPWKYRTRITVEHFFREFHLFIEANPARAEMMPVLTLFHKQVVTLYWIFNT